MPDQYTEVENTSWFNNLGNSCFGVILGILLFFSSFFVLYWNEGRLDLSKVAETAIEISATSLNNTAQSQFISTTGIITSDRVLGDNLFLKPGNYLAINRKVDMFAWVEEVKSENRKNIGGSTTKTTTYNYTKQWVNEPKNSNSFKYSESHHNPSKSIADAIYRVPNAQLGIYRLDMGNIELPDLEKVPINDRNTTLSGEVKIVNDYIFKGIGTLQNPEIGDLRIQYFALRNGSNVTVFGKLDANNQITPYIHKSKERFYRLFLENRDGAISTLKTEHSIATWIIRIMGFMMMWFGLIFSGGPISAFLDFIPIMGNISQGLAIGSTFIVAFVLSAIVILFSMLLHNIFALLLAILVTIGVLVVRRKNRA